MYLMTKANSFRSYSEDKITLKYRYNCIKGEYFLIEEQKRELEMLYGVKVNN